MALTLSGTTGVAGVDGSAGTPAVQGSDTNTGISFGTDTVSINTGGTARATVSSAGRLGVGTTNPARQLHISTAGTCNLRIADSTNGVDFEAIADSTGGAIGTVTNHTLRFFTNDTERGRFDTSGRLLVGTSSARSNVRLDGTATTPGVQIERQQTTWDGMSLLSYSSNYYSPVLTLGISQSATPGTNARVTTGSLGHINFVGNDGTNFLTAARITASVDGTTGTNDMPGQLGFYTTADGASSPTERMRIKSNGRTFLFDSSGVVLHAASSSSAGTSNYIFLGTNSASGIDTGNVSFAVYTNGNVQNTNGSYTQLSDAKLKENIVDAGSQWDDIKAIRIRNWNFKEETGYETHRQIGPVAQELETVCPGLVFETPDRDADGNETGEVTKGVNQSILYMKAVKALQEAMERIESLEARLTTLEGGTN